MNQKDMDGYFIPGLVSVTFRGLPATDVIELAVQSGIQGIEWSTRDHLNVNEADDARILGKQTRAAGIVPFCLASYYNCASETAFAPCLDAAQSMRAESIRVWAGNQDYEETGEEERERIISALKTCALNAADSDIEVTTEYHSRTLTNTVSSTEILMRQTEGSGLKTLWQSAEFGDIDASLEEIETIRPWLQNLHLFYRSPDNFHDRRPLNEGFEFWRRILTHVQRDKKRRYVSIEFVRDDNPKQFLEDATVLKELLHSIRGDLS